MARKIALGEQDFTQIRKYDCFYIDKTSFIKEWWENRDSVTLITRPRRFGKTLTLSMVEQFFSIRYAGRSDLFENLEIWKEEAYRKLQGTYPVIYLSFAGIKADNYEETYYAISRLLAREYRRHAYLLKSDSFLPSDQEQYQKILSGTGNVSDICSSVNLLCEYLYEYYNRKVLILLDEYDTPMQEAYLNGYWKPIAGFMRRFMNETFKTNPFAERSLMTGITRVSKESIFSDLNHLEVVTATSQKYAAVFGFTEEEVIQSLDEYGLRDQADQVRHWYDGFRFGSCAHIYNPWSIIQYLDKKEFAAYWVNTSSNALVGKLIQSGSSQTKKRMEDLMRGHAICVPIDEQIVFSQLDKDEDAVFSFLLAGGYLKVQDKQGQEYHLQLVNEEVHQMFEHLINGWFSECRPAYNYFIKAVLANDLDGMNDFINRVALSTFSFFDTGQKTSAAAQPERFYHGLVLGLMLELRNRYTMTSNRESGFGRYDVLLEPCDRADDGIILEFKVIQPGTEKNLEETAQAAIRQILHKNYAVALEASCGRDRIRIYGFAFRGKEVLIDGGYLREYEQDPIR